LLDPRKGDPATGGEGWQQQSTMAEAAWNHGARLLVATLDRQGDCAAQAWARAAELPAPALALDEPVDELLGSLPQGVSERIQQADTATLERWVGRVLPAASLDDVLA
jgi:hypothetical protein